MTTRKFLAFVLRLSVVVGIGFGLFDAYTRLKAWETQKTASIQHIIRMSCAAKIGDEWLTQHTDEFGIIDVASICGTIVGEKTFFVRPEEIAAVRRGEDVFKDIGPEPYNLVETFLASFTGFVLTTLLGIAMLGLFQIGKWTIYGRR